jgi:tripartite ATP-independent transporter DctP family solute receptor
MKLRRTLVIGAALLGVALAGPAPAQKMVLRAADVHPLGYPTVKAVENMGKKLAAGTNGRLTVQVFPNMVLGGEKEMIEQTQVGAIQILRTSLGAFGPIVPEVNVFNMPFIFRDEAHMRTVIDGEIGQEILDKITNSTANIVGLAYMDAGARNLYTKVPIKHPSDLKGIKVRTMGNPLFVDMMNAMGGNGISMGFNELYTALQTGVVDGAENNPPSYYTQKHHNFAKYYALTGHLIMPELLAFSKVSWNKLSKEDQDLIRKLAREAQAEQRVLWDKRVAEDTAKLRAEGVTFVEVDKKPFFEATEPVRQKYGAQYAALIKRIQAVR